MIFQVEISSVCNARCVYCPLTVLRDKWNFKFMEINLFDKFIEEARELRPEYIHLQGWGEPLLHPNFDKFVKKSLEVTKAGITTNATLLDSKLDVVADLDVVAITFAGATPATHEKYRIGCPFNKVVSNAKILAKKKRGRLIAIYMLIRDNYKELPDFIDLVADVGFDEVKISNVNYLPNAEVAKLKAFTDLFKRSNPELEKKIEEAANKSKEKGLRFASDYPSPRELTECPEQPTTTLFINVDGEVSPCVYLNLPIREAAIPRVFNNKEYKVPKVVYGKISQQPLKEIIKKANSFTAKFVYRRYNIELGNPAEPPTVCLTCYRLYGV